MSKPKNNWTRGIQLTEPHQTLDCPWGKTISWGAVVRLCKEQPVDFFQRFDFHAMDIGLGPLDLVESLFTSFTRDAWLSLHEGFLPAGVQPQPKDLKSSMETWTCQSILACLGGKCTFLPSTYGLEGTPKSKELDISFEALRQYFTVPHVVRSDSARTTRLRSDSAQTSQNLLGLLGIREDSEQIPSRF